MAISDFINTKDGTVICYGHDEPQWEKARLARSPRGSDGSYHCEVSYDCGNRIVKHFTLVQLGSANHPLFQALESGNTQGIGAWMIEHRNEL